MTKIEKENQVYSLKAGAVIIKYPVIGDPTDEVIEGQGNLDRYRVGKYNTDNGIFDLIIVDDSDNPIASDNPFENNIVEIHWRQLIKAKRWWIKD